MKNIQQNYLLSLLICIGVAACGSSQPTQKPESNTANSVSVVDFIGQEISLDQAAKRIVALAPHLVENTYSAGAGDALVGVVQYANFPKQALKLPIVGGYETINHEKILELEPDLVLSWQSGNSHGSVELLKKLGLKVYVAQADTLEQVAKSIRDIGTLAGTAELANAEADRYLAKLKEFQKKYADRQAVTTFYQVWNQPLQTISGNHTISNAIELCGGVNIYADEFAIAPIINIESILDRNPTAIIASGMSESRPEWLDEWKKWPALTAVKQDNLFFVNPDHLQRHTVRLLLGIAAVCEQLDMARAKQNQAN